MIETLLFLNEHQDNVLFNELSTLMTEGFVHINNSTNGTNKERVLQVLQEFFNCACFKLFKLQTMKITNNIETSNNKNSDVGEKYDPKSPAIFDHDSLNSGNSMQSFRKNQIPQNFNKEQLKLLEEAYSNSPYLTMLAQKNLSRKLWVCEKDIKIWFRNRRIIGNKSEDKHPIYVCWCL